jgi:hypothetical protein
LLATSLEGLYLFLELCNSVYNITIVRAGFAL